MNTTKMLTVDADAHVLEPRDTWLTYLEPKWRDRSIRIDRDDRGDEVLLIDGYRLISLSSWDAADLCGAARRLRKGWQGEDARG